MNKSARKRNLFSVILTVLVIALYLLPNFASAVSVEVKTDKGTYTETDDIVTFDVSVDIEDNERIPIQNLTLKINNTFKTCTFDVSGNKLTQCSNLQITRKRFYSDGYG